MLKYLYHLRWGIETSFREIKYCLDMICFHARKTNSIMQEIYAAVIMYNFCKRLTLSVVISIGKRKHEYQANFSMGIHICMDFFREGIPIEPELEIEKYILPVRPGRTDKRKMVKTKSAVLFFLCFFSYFSFYFFPFSLVWMKSAIILQKNISVF